jgi:hypothetical protein
MKRNIICAANFILPGLGYIFIPGKKIFGVLLLLTQVIILGVELKANTFGLYTILTDLRHTGHMGLYWIEVCGDVLFRISFAYDARIITRKS